MRYLNTTLILFAFLLTGCKPFGNKSSLNLNFDSDSVQFTGEDKSELNSGGNTVPTIPSSGNAGEIHKVSYTVGAVFNQFTYNTSDGHNISVSIKGATR